MIRLKVKEIATAKGMSRNRLSHLAILDIKVIRRMYDHPTESFTTYALDCVAHALEVDARDLIEYTPGDPPHKDVPGRTSI